MPIHGKAGNLFFFFIIALGRKTLKYFKPKINVVEKRWVGVLPFIFKLKWMNIWCMMWSMKELGFMWALWNKAIVVNTWRAEVDNSINQTCPLCGNEEESILHKFLECCHAQQAWEYTQGIMCDLAYGNKPSRVVAPLHWKQCVFVAKSPRQVKCVENIWSLPRGITLWNLWIEWNDLVFNNKRWNVVKIHKVIWDALLVYGRANWNRCMKPIRKTLRAEKKTFQEV
jgi:hypothetical protein